MAIAGDPDLAYVISYVLIANDIMRAQAACKRRKKADGLRLIDFQLAIKAVSWRINCKSATDKDWIGAAFHSLLGRHVLSTRGTLFTLGGQ
jgi:hypothetical protein